jgi:hypothetical protein
VILGIPGPKGLLIDVAIIGGVVVALIFGLGFIAGYRVARR